MAFMTITTTRAEEATGTLTAREYLRVSQDRSGRMRSTDEQHTDNVRDAEANGWALAAPYVEKGAVSASRYSKKRRGNFDRLLADLEADTFGADLLILWEPSRGSRRLGEWATLMDLCDDRGVKIYITSHRRLYDPADPRDRRSLGDDANDAEYESAKVSARSRRAMAANAAEGRPHGVCPYGYRRVYDQRSGKLAAQEIQPDEAAVVRELFTRLEAGHSLRAISIDFADRGIRTRVRVTKDGRTVGGKPFTWQVLRDMALNPCYIGMRAYKPECTSGHRHARLDHATLVKATWPALVDPKVFYTVNRRLTAAERKTTRSGRAVHLLSAIGQCDVCGGLLAARKHRTSGRAMYVCGEKGCVTVGEADLDAFAETVMLDYLARDDTIKAMRARDRDDTELRRIRDELADAQAELDELKTNVRAGKLKVTYLAEVAPALEERVAKLTDAEQEASTPDALRGLLKPGKDVRKRWNAAPMSTRREVARLLLSPDWLGELRVTRRPAGSRRVTVPVCERVTWRRSTDAQQ